MFAISAVVSFSTTPPFMKCKEAIRKSPYRCILVRRKVYEGEGFRIPKKSKTGSSGGPPQLSPHCWHRSPQSRHTRPQIKNRASGHSKDWDHPKIIQFIIMLFTIDGFDAYWPSLSSIILNHKLEPSNRWVVSDGMFPQPQDVTHIYHTNVTGTPRGIGWFPWCQECPMVGWSVVHDCSVSVEWGHGQNHVTHV